MALLSGTSGGNYDSRQMPQAAHGPGPWGEAITYWLNVRKLRQADLAKMTRLQPKTISRIVRGFHTQTQMLARIAEALGVSFDTVLVSPVRRRISEDKRHILQAMFEQMIQQMNDFIEEETPSSTGQPMAEAAQSMGARIDHLPELRREALRKMLVRHEKGHARDQVAAGAKRKLQPLRKRK
jgi:transcriptional regulator with XRE-family HTH domain